MSHAKQNGLKLPVQSNRLCSATLKIFGSLFRLTGLFALFYLLPTTTALAVDCEARQVYSVSGNQTQITQVQPDSFTHEFESGARWEFCLSFDTHNGLVINNLSYGAPNEPLLEVLREASLGQILFKYDEDIEGSHVLSDNAIGTTDLLQAGPGFCDNGDLLSVPGPTTDSNICRRQRELNTMIQMRNVTPLPRHEMSLHSWSQVGTFIYQSIWRFSEDGEITPALHLQGRLSRFTADRRYGTPVAGNERLASNATVVANWRLDFNIGGDTSPDVIEEIEFPGLAGVDALRRPLVSREVTNESFRRVDRDLFRGWLIRDSQISAIENGTTRIGYYLDPQTSGYSYQSRRYNWPSFDVAVTRANHCERLASFNTGRADGCAISLDFYTNGEVLSNQDSVVWFSLARHLVPRSEDSPAIGSLAAEFKMIPFDWSRYTPFNPPIDEL